MDYSTAAWQELRERALARDGNRCTLSRLLGGECSPVLHVDHLIPVADGGPELPGLDGVITICERHHPMREATRRAVLHRRPRPRRCPHHHAYPWAREACERKLNRIDSILTS